MMEVRRGFWMTTATKPNMSLQPTAAPLSSASAAEARVREEKRNIRRTNYADLEVKSHRQEIRSLEG